jgi:hypothetical protein
MYQRGASFSSASIKPYYSALLSFFDDTCWNWAIAGCSFWICEIVLSLGSYWHWRNFSLSFQNYRSFSFKLAVICQETFHVLSLVWHSPIFGEACKWKCMLLCQHTECDWCLDKSQQFLSHSRIAGQPPGTFSIFQATGPLFWRPECLTWPGFLKS